MDKATFGMIGLGTMGRNFLLNIAGHGIAGVGYDLDPKKRDLLLVEGKGLPVVSGVQKFQALRDEPVAGEIAATTTGAAPVFGRSREVPRSSASAPLNAASISSPPASLLERLQPVRVEDDADLPSAAR